MLSQITNICTLAVPFLLKELIELLPIFPVTLFLEVHIQDAALLFIQVFAPHDGLVAFLDHIHVVGVGGQRIVVE